jgi:hypothetical protein
MDCNKLCLFGESSKRALINDDISELVKSANFFFDNPSAMSFKLYSNKSVKAENFRHDGQMCLHETFVELSSTGSSALHQQINDTKIYNGSVQPKGKPSHADTRIPCSLNCLENAGNFTTSRFCNAISLQHGYHDHLQHIIDQQAHESSIGTLL